MTNAANNSLSRRALMLGRVLCACLMLGLSVSAHSQWLFGDTDVSLDRIRVQDFAGSNSGKKEQTRRIADQSATITNISGNQVRTELLADYGSFDLTFVREIEDAWTAYYLFWCPRDVEIKVTFEDGTMVSSLNPADSSSVIVESYGVQRTYRGGGCLYTARGSLRLYIDISDAGAAGRYSGNMTVEVNPIY